VQWFQFGKVISSCPRTVGADCFVEVIGHFLADHRELFLTDEIRRRNLIACLDTFMQAGWPAARRLLYRLPELLQ